MRTQQLSNKIKEVAEEAHGTGTPHDDTNERDALRKFLSNSPEFQDFWKSYFGTPANTCLKENPLGKCKVDLGIVDRDFESRIHGLIEVDVFNSWGETFPTYYTKFHVLERKLKYFQGTNYKYLTCTFNNTHNQMACTTRENIERCLEKYGVMDKFMTKINAYDRVVRCPLDENIFWFGVKDK